MIAQRADDVIPPFRRRDDPHDEVARFGEVRQRDVVQPAALAEHVPAVDIHIDLDHLPVVTREVRQTEEQFPLADARRLGGRPAAGGDSGVPIELTGFD